MPIPAIRAKQTTQTTGTGTLTLDAATTDFRSFATAFGASSQVVRYVLQRDGAWEVGYGTFNGGSPGTLTRDTVVASSNGGSLVSLAAGTTDVFFDFIPGERRHYNVTGSTTLTLADLGNFVRCTPSADMTLTLPGIATVPAGMGFQIRNDGTNNAVIYIDPNAAEGIDGSSTSLPMFVGEGFEVVSMGTAWRTVGLSRGFRTFATAIASASSSIDFILPTYLGALLTEYRITFRGVRPTTDGATLILRTDSDGGASYDAGASDYSQSQIYVSGAGSVAGFGSTAQSSIQLTTDIDTTAAGNSAFGFVHIQPGINGARNAAVYGQSFAAGNGAVYAGPQLYSIAGARLNAADINAVRLLASTSTIAVGYFTAEARFN